MGGKIVVVLVGIFLLGIFVTGYLAYQDPELRLRVGQLLGIKNIPTSETNDFKIEEVKVALDSPTQMVFVENDILFLEKNTGKIRIIRDGEVLEKEVFDFNVHNLGESGLLSILNVDSEIFVYLTESKEDGGKAIADNVYKLSWDGESLKNPVLVNSFPIFSSWHHGGPMVSDEHGNIFLIRGDQIGRDDNWPNNEKDKEFFSDWEPELLGHKFGKEGPLQNFGDGEIDDTGVIIKIGIDNQEITPSESEDPLKHYVAIGIRNSFGLTIDPITGFMWDTENGPQIFDEINLVIPNFNSGWKIVQGPSNSTIVKSQFENFSYSEPEFSWEKTVAPTALVFVADNWGTEFRDSLLVGDCRGNLYNFQLNDERNKLIFEDESLKDLVLNEGDNLDEILLFTGLGCITDLKFNSDGELYLVAHKKSSGIYKIYPNNLE